jgi:hypothetical protein
MDSSYFDKATTEFKKILGEKKLSETCLQRAEAEYAAIFSQKKSTYENPPRFHLRLSQADRRPNGAHERVPRGRK